MSAPRASASAPYDVAIIGSGLGGSMLATILAKHGHRVLLLEAGTHPRFAVGEALTPEFSARLKVLAELHEIPELSYLASFQQLRHHVGSNSGVKRSFTFMHHRDGVEHAPDHTNQFITLSYPLGPDSHLYRPDTDAWMVAVAVQYGVTYLERSPVEAVAFSHDGATLTAAGVVHRARFVVDGSGHRSVIARQMGLRARTDQRTDSRTIFTHMVGVRSIEDVRPVRGMWRGRRTGRRPGDSPARRLPVLASPDQSTLHHLFDGGWMWVIPFGNHSQATNPVCSVGIVYDRAQHPHKGADPEAEFRATVARFPTVQWQLGEARAVRSWVSTDRVQYRSEKLAGPRFCMLPHASSFVDALFSGGLTMTVMGVQEIARVLLPSLAADRFDPADFAELEEGTRHNIDIMDKAVHGSFVAFRSFDLFNAWHRFWALGNYHATAAFVALHMQMLASGDRAVLRKAYEPPYRRSLSMDDPRLAEMFDAGYAVMLDVEAGRLAEAEAVDRLFALLQARAWIPPQFRATDRHHRYLMPFSVFHLLRLMWWGKLNAPDDMKRIYYGVGPEFFGELTRSVLREGRRSVSGFLRMFRDAHESRGWA